MITNNKGKIRKHLLSPKLLDEIMNSGGGSGQANIAVRKYHQRITSDTNKIYIGTDHFSEKTDVLLVFRNSVYLENEIDYTFNPSDKTITRADGHNWEASSEIPTMFFFVCILNVPSADVKFDGSKLLDGTVTEDKLSNEVKQKLNKTVESLNGSKLENNSITEDKLDQSIKDKLNRPAARKYTHNYGTGDWSSSANDEMFTIRVTHNLNSEDLIVTGICSDTKRNIALSYRIIDVNNIEIELTKKINLRLVCYCL